MGGRPVVGWRAERGAEHGYLHLHNFKVMLRPKDVLGCRNQFLGVK